MSFLDKISVILPVKNGAEFIESCIQSFLDQNSVNFTKEMILVDDHSTDETYKILQKNYSENDEIKILQNTGQGIMDALQMGYSNSSGNLVSRMDADDIMPEGKLQNLWNILSTQIVNVATGKVKYFHFEKDKVGDGFLKYEKWLNRLVDGERFYKEIYKECVVASPNWLIRRDDFDRAGGFKGKYPEDYDLVFRWYQKGYVVKGCNQITHHWYDHQKRASRNDDHYKENNFFDLKLYWFLKIDFNPSKGIMIYGAGNKGKYLAKAFTEKGFKIMWCSNNEKKIGKNIYGVTLISDQENLEETNCQIIIAIAVEEDKMKINDRFKNSKMEEGKDYFFFS